MQEREEAARDPTSGVGASWRLEEGSENTNSVQPPAFFSEFDVRYKSEASRPVHHIRIRTAC